MQNPNQKFNPNPAPNLSPGRRFWRTFLLTVGIIVIFAYGFQVTQIDLEEPKQENRQNQLINVIRSLARPDLVVYETERLNFDASILVPCSEGELGQTDTPPAIDGGETSINLSATCAEPGSEVTVTGVGFAPGEDVFLYFVPYKEDPEEMVELPLTNEVVRADRDGSFVYALNLKKDRTSEFPQQVRAVVKRTSGLPYPSETVYDTFDKIIETIFLALIATTLGTALSIPISFLAARNLMIEVTSLFGSFVTLIVAAPLGWVLGSWLFGTFGSWGAMLLGQGAVTGMAGLWASALLFMSVQAATGPHHQQSGWLLRLRSFGLVILGGAAAAFLLGMAARLGQVLGLWLESVLGVFDFLGYFLFVLGDAIAILLPFFGGLIGLFVAASLAGSSSETLLRRIQGKPMVRVYSVIMAGLAGFVLTGLIASFIAWLYEFINSYFSANIGLPALIGGIVAAILALFIKVNQPVPSGLIIYYVSRTILNVLRAIEPLIMAIVFVVWVGIGPFAGVLALTLHTIAALGKLYSEQVENIAEGPVEAITATGANRLQTIIYAVVPQIVPPYIAFTIYRWDINVRMSTIIGFAGGGGIGFLLQQNLNLLKYRQAAVQMIAIAIVVASLDYVSAKIRERII